MCYILPYDVMIMNDIVFHILAVCYDDCFVLGGFFVISFFCSLKSVAVAEWYYTMYIITIMFLRIALYRCKFDKSINNLNMQMTCLIIHVASWMGTYAYVNIKENCTNMIHCKPFTSIFGHSILYSLNNKTSYRKISWSREATRFGLRLF